MAVRYTEAIQQREAVLSRHVQTTLICTTPLLFEIPARLAEAAGDRRDPFAASAGG